MPPAPNSGEVDDHTKTIENHDVDYDEKQGTTILGADGHSEEEKEEQKSIDKQELRRLMWKIDLRIMPLVSLFYLCAYLDRVNIGNAKVAGLTETIDITESEYNGAVSAFFAGYVLFELPSNMVLNRVGPPIWISTIMILWGVTMAAMSAVKNGTQLIVVRILLGAAEAGLIPAILFYMSLWYTKREMTKRVAILLANIPIAGVIGGVLAYAIMRLEGARGLHAWQWIFIIEAIPPLVLAIIGFFFLPNFPERGTFLCNRERELFYLRMKNSTASFALFDGPANQYNASWKKPIVDSFKDWKVYLFSIITFCNFTSTSCISVFLPSVVYGFGYSALNAQLMTIPANAIASVLAIAVAASADHYGERGYHVAIPTTLSVIAFALLIALKDSSVTARYIFVTLGVCGISSAFTINASWYASSTAGRMKRAASIAIIASFGNLGGILGGQLYRSSDAPQYIHGHIAVLVLLSCAAVLSIMTKLFIQRENRRRDNLTAQERHDILTKNDPASLGDQHPDFRYIS